MQNILVMLEEVLFFLSVIKCYSFKEEFVVIHSVELILTSKLMFVKHACPPNEHAGCGIECRQLKYKNIICFCVSKKIFEAKDKRTLNSTRNVIYFSLKW